MPACPPTLWATEISGIGSLERVDPTTYLVPDGATGASSVFTNFGTTGTYSSASVSILWYDASDHFLGAGAGINIAHSSDTLPRTVALVMPAGSDYFKLAGFLLSAVTPGASVGFTGIINWSGSCDPVAYCTYGTRAKTGSPGVITITTTLIEAVLGLLLRLHWQVPLNVLIGLNLDVSNLCSLGPQPMPAVFSGGPLGLWSGIPTTLELIQAFQSMAWYYFCECVPATGGDPTPVPFPIPPDTSPGTGVPDPVPVLCDNNDICTTLNNLVTMVSAIATSLLVLRHDVTLIQRQKVPLNYVRGPIFAGLTSQGTLTVSGILGLSVTFTTSPSFLGSDMATYARSSYFLGWLNLGTPDGWLRKVKLTHNPHLVMDIDADVTQLAYDLVAGAVADLQLLTRTP